MSVLSAQPQGVVRGSKQAGVKLRPPQTDVFLSPKRFRVLVAGRRFGKTYLSTVELMRAATDPAFTSTPVAERLIWYVAPTYKQAKQNAWNPLKKLTQPHWRRRPNETGLSIELKWGARIELRGADNYDALRGVGLDFVVFDEYADMKPEAWTEIMRPALSDRQGKALWIGTPRGFSHFHDLWTKAAAMPDWAAFRFTSLEGGNIPEAEILAAAADVDEKTFRQEYEAAFENMATGACYYAFDRALNLAPQGYQSSNQLCWALDFNVDPMCSVIAQIEDSASRADALMGRRAATVRVLDEICLPDSNIREACAEFARRAAPYAALKGSVRVNVYGDAAGNSRTHAGASDWELVREYFRNDSRFVLTFKVPSADPPVKDRLTAVNSMLCNSLGEARLFLDPKCRELARDFEQVAWKPDASGNLTAQIDKRDPRRTHFSDSLGYLIWREFPVRERGGPQASPLI
jgi:Terminase large subunit, T4likevirus-type, N-terminal